MEDKHATIKDEVIPDLLVSPHIVDELFYVVMGELQIDSTQQEQIVEHLSACEYCRKALLVLLSADRRTRCRTTIRKVKHTTCSHNLQLSITKLLPMIMNKWGHMLKRLRPKGEKKPISAFP